MIPMTTTDFTQRLHGIFGDDSRTFPLVVGMTGHRRLFTADLPELKKQTRLFFETLWNGWKAGHKSNSEMPPMTVLCGMAEGADMLVAETVLKLKAAKPNGMKINLVAVLPMSRNMYENDFQPGNALENGALKRFQNMLAKADSIVEMPTNTPLEKTEQYEKLGFYIARHSFILLALCEEKTDEIKSGGSADVISIKLNGVRANSTFDSELLDFNCVGPVFQLITRQTNSTTVNENNLFRWIVQERQHPCDGESVSKTDPVELADACRKVHETKKIIKRIAKLNIDLLKYSDSIKQGLSGNLSGTKKFFLEHDDEEIRFLGKHYAACDILSGHFQDKNNKSVRFYWRWLTVAGCLASFYFFTYWLKGPGLPFFPMALGSNVVLFITNILYTLCALGIIVYWFRHQWSGFYSHHHAYRSIAEGLRVQIFWRVAEIEDSVAVYYLSHQIGELDWLRVILRTMMLPLKQELPKNGGGLAEVHGGWVKDQENYFVKKFRDLTTKSKHFECLKTPLIIVPIALWATFKLWDSTINSIWCMNSHCNSLVLTTVMLGFALLSLAVASMLSYNRLMGNSQNAARYYRMVPIFAQASDLLEKLKTTGKQDRQREVIRELGREALAENAEWLLQQQEIDLLK